MLSFVTVVVSLSDGALRMLYLKIVALAVCFSLSLSQIVMANPQSHQTNYLDDENTFLPTGEWFLGASVGYGKITNPLSQRDDLTLYIIPDIRYYDERLSIENLDISYALLQRKNLSFELIGQQNLDGLFFPGKHRNTIASVAGMPGFGPVIDEDGVGKLPPPTASERSLSYMAGAELRYYGAINVLVSATTDVSNVHHGQEYHAIAHKLFTFNSIILEIQAGVTHKSRDLIDYYYGFEVPIGYYEVNHYEPNSALNSHVKIDLTYAYSDNWYLVSSLKNEWLDDTIANSPIVNDDQVTSVFFGIKYMY